MDRQPRQPVPSRATLTALLSILAISSASAELFYRWSFNGPDGATPAGTVLADAAAGFPLTVRGQGAVFESGRITLPGTTNGDRPEAEISAYLDLPNGMISARTSVTLEFWAAPLDGREWAPLFDFGRWNAPGDGLGAPGEWTGLSAATPPGGTMSGDALALLLSRGSNLNQQRLGVTRDGVRADLDTELPTTPGQTYHYVLTVTDGAGVHGANGMQVAWYRDGALVGTLDVAHRLDAIEDVNCWLGRLQWTGLGVAHVAYDEFRFYDHALSAAEVTASFAAGPDAAFAPPELQPDAAVLHHGQKVRVAVLANDPAGVSPASVEVVEPPEFGTATPDGEGRILYHHTTGAPAADTFTYRATGAGGAAEAVAVTLEFAAGLRIANPQLALPDQPPVTSIALEPAFGGLFFQEPVVVASPPEDEARLFVVERRRGIRLIPDTAAATPSSVMFFDLAAYLAGRGEMLGDTFDQGVFGLAFHPDFATNRYFFCFYSARVAGLDYFRVSRFTVEAADPGAVDPGSEHILLQQNDANGYHLGTDLEFGPDGYLYITTGDGGGQNDSRGYGQLIDRDFFCAILRIDVDRLPGNREPNAHPSVPRDGGVARYAVPADNPYVTDAATVPYNGETLPAASVRTEIWANGFRNPFQISFDGQTGELWCGDVGQNAREEINLVTRGGNYGWAYREGTIDGPREGESPAGFSGLEPLYEYPPGNGPLQGFSVSGGIVYRGTAVSGLTGAYVFADYVSGNIWALRRSGGEGEVEVERVAGEAGITSFGLDPATGDLLAVDHGGSRILRFTDGGDEPTGFPQTLGATGLFADLADLSPAPGLLPYTPNLSFWSDHASKRRWFLVPGASDRMTYSRDDPWTFPPGTVWVKHFDLELERGNPSTARRIETRLLVRNDAGSYGVSYRWNEAQTDATLVPDAGDVFPLEVVEGGVARTQTYRIPSRAECLACHTAAAGHALSFDTRQLNRTGDMNGFAGNQLDLLHAGGYLENAPPSPHLLPRHVRPDETGYAIAARARSYLAVNCANCHRAGAAATSSWDGRAHLTLEETGLLDGAAVNDGGDPANRLVVAGDTAHSIVLNRVAATNGFSRMPSIGSNELDAGAIALLTGWINASLPARQTYDAWRQQHFGAPGTPDGAPDADPDGDGDDNATEFLAGTDPHDHRSQVAPAVAVEGGTATVDIDLPAGRAFRVETSADLINWSTWDVPGNDGLPRTAGHHSLSGPFQPPVQYFRFRVLGE